MISVGSCPAFWTEGLNVTWRLRGSIPNIQKWNYLYFACIQQHIPLQNADGTSIQTLPDFCIRLANPVDTGIDSGPPFLGSLPANRVGTQAEDPQEVGSSRHPQATVPDISNYDNMI